jgi:2-C-methyl-D-erythritol 4-phosphate cytidylyltransferase
MGSAAITKALQRNRLRAVRTPQIFAFGMVARSPEELAAEVSYDAGVEQSGLGRVV